MRNSKLCMLALGLLACALMTTAVQADTWYVPSQVGTVTEALGLASSGDVIAVAVGVHKIAGYGHQLTPGITIRSDTGMPGGVVFEESSVQHGGWRDGPVFILDPTLSPTDAVVIENIILKNFTDTFGPDAHEAEPIFNILGGELIMTNCQFDTYYGTALKFDGGSGVLDNCDFFRGNANPAALAFAGESLTLTSCVFNENSYRHTDLIPQEKYRRMPGSIIRLDAGELFCDCSEFERNGPLSYLVDVGPNATMHACTSCLQDNRTAWQGRVAGTVQLDGCTANPARWLVLPGGLFLTVDEGSPMPMSVETTTWSHVRSLFE